MSSSVQFYPVRDWHAQRKCYSVIPAHLKEDNFYLMGSDYMSHGFDVKGPVCQGWVVDWAPTAPQKGANGGIVSTPLPIKLLSLASPPRHLDSNRKGGCVCEERTVRRYQTRQAQPGLSCKASKCSYTGTGDLCVLTTQETSSMKMTTTRTTHLVSASLVMLQDVPKVSCSRTVHFPHSLAWVTTIKADVEPPSRPRVVGHARRRKDWVDVSTWPSSLECLRPNRG